MIAIPTVNAGEPLDSCLKALERQTFQDFEVIVIDNGGTVNPATSSAFPLRIIRPGHNTGFGAAINLAIRASSSPLIACLNDDAEPEPGCLEALVLACGPVPGKDARVGMYAPLIRMRDTGLIDSAGMQIALDGSSRQRGHGLAPERFAESDEVLFPGGCCALYRRAALAETGLFEESFFLYCEDTDLGLRLQRHGWTCRYVPDARVTHRYSASAGSFSALKARLVERNRVRVAVRNFPLALLILLPVFSAVRYFWQFVAVLERRGAASSFVSSGNSPVSILRLLAGVWLESLRELPSLLRQRRGIAENARTPIGALLMKYRIPLRDLARA